MVKCNLLLATPTPKGSVDMENKYSTDIAQANSLSVSVSAAAQTPENSGGGVNTLLSDNYTQFNLIANIQVQCPREKNSWGIFLFKTCNPVYLYLGF